jgi:thiol-disulfide isomerase/thioredoxin
MPPAILPALLLVLAMLSAPVARGDVGWLLEFEEGRAAAIHEGKDLLIDFGGSDWCAPCAWLKERVLSRPEFIGLASGRFVLVDIDLPFRSPIAADRKKRYEDLQERFGIRSFPSLVLATSDGRAYARATYRERFQAPEEYWKHLAPLVERGARLREALARVGTVQERAKAGALAEALAEVDPRFVPLFFADLVADLRSLDPADSTGYLAHLDGRKALDDLQAKLDLRKASIEPKEVDALIARDKLRGESLQEALVLRAAGEVLAGDDARALGTFSSVLDAQATRTRFDGGDSIPLDADSIATVRRRIAEGKANRGDGVGLLYALHRIFDFDLPNAYELSCGGVFQPGVRIREILGDRYGKALIRSTEGLRGEARARALALGLDGTFFIARGSIREVVIDLIPSLVGKETAMKLLPGPYYPRWID